MARCTRAIAGSAKCVKELHGPEQQHAQTHRLFIKLCWLMSTYRVTADRVLNIDETSCRLLPVHQIGWGHDIHGRLQHGPRAGHAGADCARGQDRRRPAGAALPGAHLPRHVRERLGHHDDLDPAARGQIGRGAEPDARPHFRCPTWSGASHCVWFSAPDRVNASENCHLHYISASPSLLSHVSVVSCVWSALVSPCLHVLTTSPRLPESHRRKNEFFFFKILPSLLLRNTYQGPRSLPCV